jgi:hypothetical protein
MNIKTLIPFYKNYVRAMSRLSALEMAFDYVLKNPEYIDESGWAFNGQKHRQKIFCELAFGLQFASVFETGTFMGNTTGFMRKRVDCPVITCEISSTFQTVAISRLRKMNGITFMLGDSRKFLFDSLSKSTLLKSKSPLFFYLDAHWHDDLPLFEEIEIIGKFSRESVIMIDDFAVPGDSDYNFDNYGHGKSLDIETFGSCFINQGFRIYFPSISGNEETGGKRGCVILVGGDALCQKIDKFDCIVKYNL